MNLEDQPVTPGNIATPPFVCKTPEPKLVDRMYGGRKIMLFQCFVETKKVTGWDDNPRIKILKQSRLNGSNRALTEEEIFDLMKNDDSVKLSDLSNDIVSNGLREPIVFTFKGDLLDGNRRYFAIKLAFERGVGDEQVKEKLEKIPALVMLADASEKDIQAVLIEENFAPSLKIEWDDYIKAQYILKDYETGLDDVALAKKYNWKKGKVRETIRIGELIDDFRAIATADLDPESDYGGGFGLSDIKVDEIITAKYQFFNEAQKSFYNELQTNIDFKTSFFSWLKNDKFKNFQEVRVALKIFNNEEAKREINKDQSDAGRTAKAVIEYQERVVNKYDFKSKIEELLVNIKTMTVEDLRHVPERLLPMLDEALTTLKRLIASVRPGDDSESSG